MLEVSELCDRLIACPAGTPGWREFEDICIDILQYLFSENLQPPMIQQRTISGSIRRDAVFPNRNRNSNNGWGLLFDELDARLILFEFKNYEKEEIGKEELDQINSYMNKPMGRLGLLVCNKQPNRAAHIRRNTIYSEQSKVILFLTKEHIIEMLQIKERGEDPADLIVDLVEQFYLQHE